MNFYFVILMFFSFVSGKIIQANINTSEELIQFLKGKSFICSSDKTNRTISLLFEEDRLIGSQSEENAPRYTGGWQDDFFQPFTSSLTKLQKCNDGEFTLIVLELGFSGMLRFCAPGKAEEGTFPQFAYAMLIKSKNEVLDISWTFYNPTHRKITYECVQN